MRRGEEVKCDDTKDGWQEDESMRNRKKKKPKYKKERREKILHCRNVSVVFENSAIYYNPTVIEYHG